MKKLTLLLAMLSLIVGALFLSACSEPMGSETDDGLTYIGINGFVYYESGGEWVTVPLGVTVKLYSTAQMPWTLLETAITNSNGRYDMGTYDTGYYKMTSSWGDLSDSVDFYHSSPSSRVNLYLE